MFPGVVDESDEHAGQDDVAQGEKQHPCLGRHVQEHGHDFGSNS